MRGASVQAAVGTIVAGENDLVYVPRGGCKGRRPIFLFHGQLRPAADWNDVITAPGSTNLAWGLARAGFVVIAAYWSGPTWGNAAFRAEVELARAYAGTLGAATDKFIAMGASMGAFEVLSLAQHVPSEVVCGVGLIPAVDLSYFRDNNVANARNYINSAFGLPAGSTSATNPLPADANPFVDTNAALITSPIKFYGSSSDTTADWTKTLSMAEMINATADDVNPTGGHTEATIAAAPVDDICDFALAHAV
jgi:pimeloyl-ACP methyl ester carboxylesterase